MEVCIEVRSDIDHPTKDFSEADFAIRFFFLYNNFNYLFLFLLLLLFNFLIIDCYYYSSTDYKTWKPLNVTVTQKEGGYCFFTTKQGIIINNKNENNNKEAIINRFL